MPVNKVDLTLEKNVLDTLSKARPHEKYGLFNVEQKLGGADLFEKLVIGMVNKVHGELPTYIEYWYKDSDIFTDEERNFENREAVLPHLEMNFRTTSKLIDEYGFSSTGNWLHNMKSETLFPAHDTILIYLEADNIEGGELGVSDIDWRTLENPFTYEEVSEAVRSNDYKLVKPETGTIYTVGIGKYHWVEHLKAGKRVSFVLNTWKTRDDISHTDEKLCF